MPRTAQYADALTQMAHARRTGGRGTDASPYTGWHARLPLADDVAIAFAPGVYDLPATLQLPYARVKFVAPWGNAVIRWSGGAAPMIRAVAPSIPPNGYVRHRYEGLVLDGNDTATKGFDLEAVHDARIDADIYGVTDVGLDMRWCVTGRVCVRISPDFNARDNAVMPDVGVRLDQSALTTPADCTHLVLDSCWVNRCGVGFDLLHAMGVVFQGGSGELSTTYGVRIGPGSQAVTLLNFNTEACNAAAGPHQGVGVDVQGATKTAVINHVSFAVVRVSAGSDLTTVWGGSNSGVVVASGATRTLVVGVNRASIADNAAPGQTQILNSGDDQFHVPTLSTGVVRCAGNADITADPPAIPVGDVTGWKRVMYSPFFADGVANYTYVVKTGHWLSLFAANPLNDASDTVPDSHATASLRTDNGGEVWVGRNRVLAARQAAIPDTGGATLAQLESEVNKLKAMCRAHGLIS